MRGLQQQGFLEQLLGLFLLLGLAATRQHIAQPVVGIGVRLVFVKNATQNGLGGIKLLGQRQNTAIGELDGGFLRVGLGRDFQVLERLGSIALTYGEQAEREMRGGAVWIFLELLFRIA